MRNLKKIVKQCNLYTNKKNLEEHSQMFIDVIEHTKNETELKDVELIFKSFLEIYMNNTSLEFKDNEKSVVDGLLKTDDFDNMLIAMHIISKITVKK